MACKDCVTGGIHQGTPLGHETNILGLNCYTTSPSILARSNGTPTPHDARPAGHIVILTDALGYKFTNTRLLADRYAARCNAKVYIPDFMDGHGMDTSVFESMDILMGHGSSGSGSGSPPGMLQKAGALAHIVAAFIPFLWFTRQAVCEPKIRTWMAGFRDTVERDSNNGEKDGKMIGAAGFCWGGKYAFLLSRRSAAGGPLLDCAFTAHPSNLVLPVDAQMVASPMCVVVGDRDVLLPVGKVEQMKEVLEAEEGLGCEVTVLPGAAHGFALRARPGDEEAMAQGVEAENAAVEWFKRYFRA
jgi:dienelactone hydrolase